MAKTFQVELISIIIVLIVGIFSRIAFSIVILYLFEAVELGQLNQAYIFSGILMVLWYFYMLTYQTADYLCYILASNIKGAMAMLLYTCLLYTSPSPRDATLSRMPSSA